MSITRYNCAISINPDDVGPLMRYDDHVADKEAEVERLTALLKESDDERVALKEHYPKLRSQLAEARAKYDELATALWPCRNLLALMNGDGGHRQHGVGIEQAAKEAEAKYTRMANALAAAHLCDCNPAAVAALPKTPKGTAVETWAGGELLDVYIETAPPEEDS